MTVEALVLAAIALSVERICYAWIWHAPATFRRFSGRLPLAALRDPIAALRALFYACKLLQAAVFIAWCGTAGSLWTIDAGPPAISLGVALIGLGQFLNASVFYRLGTAGVFYGDRFGREVPRCRRFPFSVLAHPQYVGAVLTVWGLFIVMRFPHPDWYWLPAVETVYYAIGAWIER